MMCLISIQHEPLAPTSCDYYTHYSYLLLPHLDTATHYYIHTTTTSCYYCIHTTTTSCYYYMHTTTSWYYYIHTTTYYCIMPLLHIVSVRLLPLYESCLLCLLVLARGLIWHSVLHRSFEYIYMNISRFIVPDDRMRDVMDMEVWNASKILAHDPKNGRK